MSVLEKKSNLMAQTDKVSISLVDVLVLFIIMISISAVVLLVLGLFSSVKALIIGSALSSAIIRFFRCRIKCQLIPSLLIIILLVGLFFRAEPYLWIMGNQDQGLYVNMAASYERTGGVFIKDGLRENVSKDLRGEYDRTQLLFKVISESPKDLQGEYPRKYFAEKKRFFCAMTMPGIYIKNLDTSEFVFQFYPLHPLWMAIFGKMFGSGNWSFSLLFFGLITLLMVYNLTYELSRRKNAAYLATAFFAVNPLHSYMSKLPVSEVLTLFFSISSIYYVIRYLKSGKVFANFYYVAAAGMLFCLFMNHISGIFYLPVIYGITIICLILLGRNKTSQKVTVVSITSLLLFTISALYGYYFSFPYFLEQYYKFSQYFGIYWFAVLVALTVVLCAFLSLVYNYVNYRPAKNIENSYVFANNLAKYVLFIFLSFAIVKAGLLMFTDYYADNWFINKLWDASHKGLQSLTKTNIVVFIEHISPVGFILLMAGAVSKKYQSNGMLFLKIYLIFFVLYRLVIFHFTPYQYYYARYLLPELVPYSLIFVAIYLSHLYEGVKITRVFAIVSTVLIIGYFSLFTSFQLRGREADGVKQALDRISHNLDEKDLLVYAFNDSQYFKASDSRIITPLKYYYGLNMFFVNELNELDGALFKSISNNYNDVFIVSPKQIISHKVQLVDEIDCKQGMFVATDRIPTQFTYQRQNYYLYRLYKPTV